MSKKSTKKRANRAKTKKKKLEMKATPESILPPKLKSEPEAKPEPELIPQPAQLIDLDEKSVAEPLENLERAPKMSLKLHALNVRLPWLKVVALVLLTALVVVGVEEVLRHNTNPPASVQVDSAPGELPAVTEVPTGVELATNTTPAEQPESPNTETPKPEAPATTTENKPSVQPSQGRKLIALTFDDGPSAAQTPRLLQILKEKDVKATFFVLGNMAQKSPGVIRQAEADGHEVESHTMTHANLKRSTVEGIKWEVAAINGVFTEILGHTPSLTRPPYGNVSNEVRTYVNQPLILWTVDPEDWKYKDAAAVRSKVVNGAFDGAIILMHDIYATTVDAVPGIIDELRAAGYEFMTISELAAARGVQLQNGVTYGSFRP